MKILFTGANGFLGSNVIPVLQKNNFQVSTLGIKNSDYNIDLSKEVPEFHDKFDVVFHAAGKAHQIPKNDVESQIFFDVNLTGTKNLCEALESSGLPKYFFFISTVAVYGIDKGDNIDEDYPLKGKTPYAKSKIEAEKYLQSWCDKNKIILYILRPSLIAGRNPPGNLGDMISAIKRGRYANIGGGKAKKSIIWAADFAQIIEKGIGRHGGIFNVCDNSQPDFKSLSKVIAVKLDKKQPKNISVLVMKIAAIFGDIVGNSFPLNSLKLEKITKSLTFSNSKIKNELDFHPTNVLKNFEC